VSTLLFIALSEEAEIFPPHPIDPHKKTQYKEVISSQLCSIHGNFFWAFFDVNFFSTNQISPFQSLFGYKKEASCHVSSLKKMLKSFINGLLLAGLSTNVLAKNDDIKGSVIGIDLGTTYSCVGVYKHGRVEIIANDQGNRITPSYVAFTDSNERLVGDAAKNQAPSNPINTIFDAKRLIGRRFDEKEVQNDMKHWPFKVVSKEGKPQIKVTVKGAEKVFSPEEVSAMVLGKMKEIAEAYLGETVTHAGKC
jgi:hypothetical protein